MNGRAAVTKAQGIKFFFNLESGAGDVFVLDLLRLFEGVAGEVVSVPDYAFAGDFRVVGEELKGVSGGGGVVFLVGEFGGLDGGLFFLAETAVEDGQLVVGGEIVGVDDLQALVGVAGLRVVVLLVVAEAEFAEGVFGAGIFGEHGLKVGDGFGDLAGVAFDEGAVVAGSGGRRATG